ncbi:formate dehydrogenase accessory sulfurtransferase FdhD [Chloroflexota bacterium]
MDIMERLHINRITKGIRQDTEDSVIKEMPLTITLNNRELVTLLCSPHDLKYLAIGFLSSEGLIRTKEEIKQIVADERRGLVRVETIEDKELASEFLFKRLVTSGCGGGASFYRVTDAQWQAKIESPLSLSATEILDLVKELHRRSQTFRTTGGVHSAALCNTKSILAFNEDIGRHNAIDKIFGECLLKDTPTDGQILMTSGRISSEILLKAVKRSIPILISKSAPTSMAVQFADEFGMTLVGFVRGQRMNVYTHGWRIVTDD